jgi:hypothetical protein
MSYLERYTGKRRVVKRALKLKDKEHALIQETIRVRNAMRQEEVQMTGGDMGAYNAAIGMERDINGLN